MPFENNGTLQEWHMTHNPPEIDNMTLKKWCLTKIVHLAKKCQGLSWVIFKRKFLNFLYDSDSWSLDFKIEFFSLQSDIPITLLCLIVRVGSISRVLVVLQKANNVAVNWHFYEMQFMLDANFAKRYFW